MLRFGSHRFGSSAQIVQPTSNHLKRKISHCVNSLRWHNSGSGGLKAGCGIGCSKLLTPPSWSRKNSQNLPSELTHMYLNPTFLRVAIYAKSFSSLSAPVPEKLTNDISKVEQVLRKSRKLEKIFKTRKLARVLNDTRNVAKSFFLRPGSHGTRHASGETPDDAASIHLRSDAVQGAPV